MKSGATFPFFIASTSNTVRCGRNMRMRSRMAFSVISDSDVCPRTSGCSSDRCNALARRTDCSDESGLVCTYNW